MQSNPKYLPKSERPTSALAGLADDIRALCLPADASYIEVYRAIYDSEEEAVTELLADAARIRRIATDTVAELLGLYGHPTISPFADETYVGAIANYALATRGKSRGDIP